MLAIPIRRTAAIVATIALLLGAALLAVNAQQPTAKAAPAALQAPSPPAEQHYCQVVHTDRQGYFNFRLQRPVNPFLVVVKFGSCRNNHLGGEDPSFALANFEQFLSPFAGRGRAIGWHADVSSGRAEFRYYSDRDANLAIDVYPRTGLLIRP